MTTSPDDSASTVEKYSVHLGLGLLLVVVLGLAIAQFGTAGEQATIQQSNRGLAPPPMPMTKVEEVENEVIGQIDIDYDASLKLSTVDPAD